MAKYDPNDNISMDEVMELLKRKISAFSDVTLTKTGDKLTLKNGACMIELDIVWVHPGELLELSAVPNPKYNTQPIKLREFAPYDYMLDVLDSILTRINKIDLSGKAPVISHYNWYYYKTKDKVLLEEHVEHVHKRKLQSKPIFIKKTGPVDGKN